MVRISDARLDYFMAEDVPYIDLTSAILGIENIPGKMEYYSRESCIVAGAEIVARLAKNAGCEAKVMRPSGEQADPNEPIVAVYGSAGSLHQVWKVGLNMLDHLSAVATKARKMVNAAHEVNPGCEVLATRKSMPGCKDLLMEAIMVGGAYPHRLGLSETILVFDHHISFIGGFEEFVKRIPEIRSHCVEKKLFVEASPDQAVALARAGVDGIQFDKLSPEALASAVNRVREIDPRITLIAAGGVNPENAASYAATGVDGLATTALFNAKPLDMSVRIAKAN